MHDFLSLGQAYVVCGDEKGRLWTYHITDLQKSSFQSGKPIQPTEVSPLPNILLFHSEPSGGNSQLFVALHLVVL